MALGKVNAIQPSSIEQFWDCATVLELAALTQEWSMGIAALTVLTQFTEHPDAKVMYYHYTLHPR